MLKCESCNATFEPADGLAEVTSLRVLCPECQAERKAARPRKAVAGPAAAGEPRELPPDAETPRPAPRRTPAAPPAPPPARDARPAPVPARPIAPSAKPPAKGGAAADARRRLAEAEAARARRRELHEHARDTGRSLQKKSKREVLLGFLGAVLVLVVAGVVLWRVVGTKRAEAERRQAALDRIDAFRKELSGIEIATVAGAERLLAFTEEKKDFWSNDPELNSEVIGRTAKAKNLIEAEREKATVSERFQAIEGDLAKAAELAPSDLADLRRRIDDLAPKTALLGADFTARLALARETAESAHVASLSAAAEKAAAAEPLDRAALTVIQQAEDEILKIYEASYRAWQKDMKDPEISARKEDYENRYRAVIDLSDAAVERFFTPDVIDNIPWRDLLSAAEKSHWRGASVKGFEWRTGDGVLHMIGPAPEEKSEGIISIGDKEVWRDFVVDAEFTLVRGHTNIFFRLPPAWQENVKAHELTTDEGHLIPEQPYEYTFRVIGSSFTFETPGDDPRTDTINWTRVRKGALALAIPKESEIKFTRLRVKILR